jgi:mycothiol synthase
MLRELTENDLPALVDLCAKGLPFEPHAWTERLVREKTFGARDFDPALALGFEAGGHLLGFIQGVARDHLGERRGWVRLLVVNPAWWDQGIGGQLLSEIERRVAERGAERIGIMDSVPNYLTPGVDFRCTAAFCFLTKRGYEKKQGNLNLMCDLSRDDFSDCDRTLVDLAHRGFEVRRAEPADRAACAAWAEREFAGWREEIDACFANDPISLWICLREGEIAGFSAYDSNNVGTGFYGPLGVSPVTRGHGIGALVTRLCLRDLRRQGHRRAVIPWVGPVRFYNRCCGAWIDRLFWAFEKRL